MLKVYNLIITDFLSHFDCFFFQAEDGIRDHCVTGVQTCALPICALHLPGHVRGHPRAGPPEPLPLPEMTHETEQGFGSRSEERRVGKECRSRWLQHQ